MDWESLKNIAPISLIPSSRQSLSVRELEWGYRLAIRLSLNNIQEAWNAPQNRDRVQHLPLSSQRTDSTEPYREMMEKYLLI
jgi:hypothetical protein